MDNGLSYDDWLRLINDLSKPLPYDDGTIRIFIDAVAFVLAGFNFIPAERRTALEFLNGLDIAASARIHQAAGAPSSDELQDLLSGVFRLVIVYAHRRLEERSGQGLSQCTLDPPCPHHP